MTNFTIQHLRPFSDATGPAQKDFGPVRGIISLFSTILLFLYCGPLLRLLDPTAAVVDIGVLSLLLLGLLAGVSFVAVSRWLLGLLWPVFRDFRNHHFEPIFKSLLPWQKIIIYLSCFFLLLYALILCLAAVF